MTTHYETLGVAATADAPTLRAAYLAKARRHHPDRHVDAPPAARAAAARTMREVNAAWAVLSDPAARARYDRTLAPPVSSTPRSSTSTARPAARPAAARPATPRPPVEREPVVLGHPLRYVPAAAIVLVLFAIFVFTAFAAGGGADDVPRPTVAPGDLAPGSCVTTGRTLVTVPCDQPHDAAVVAVIAPSRGCPAGTAVYTLDAQRLACLRPTP